MRILIGCLVTITGIACLLPPLDAAEVVVWGTLAGYAPAGNDFVDVDGGMLHGLALRSDGSLVNFGNSAYWGGSTPAGTGYRDIACGFNFDVAIKADGSLVAWGNPHDKDIYHQLDVPAGNDYVAVAAGLQFGLALRSNGTVVGWGSNAYGQLNVPAGTYKSIFCGGYHGIALTTSNTVACWGKSNEGQLGAYGWAALDIGGARENTYIVRTSGVLRAWGTNLSGEGLPSAGSDYVQVTGDYMHGYGLHADGTISGWGMNYYGAVNVPSDGDYIFIAAGERSGYALKFQPASLMRGSAACTGDLDGFTSGGYSVLGLGGATPLPFTVELDNLSLDSGMATLVVDYDPAVVADAGLTEDSLRLYWWDGGSSAWSLAGCNSNNDDSTGQFVAGAPTSVLGDWGIDVEGNYLWANIDHASTYGVAGDPIPEPTTVALFALSAVAIDAFRRRRS